MEVLTTHRNQLSSPLQYQPWLLESLIRDVLTYPQQPHQRELIHWQYKIFHGRQFCFSGGLKSISLFALGIIFFLSLTSFNPFSIGQFLIHLGTARDRVHGHASGFHPKGEPLFYFIINFIIFKSRGQLD